jgi:hypothetical protein
MMLHKFGIRLKNGKIIQPFPQKNIEKHIHPDVKDN